MSVEAQRSTDGTAVGGGRRKSMPFRAVGLWVAAALILLALAILIGLPAARQTTQQQTDPPPATGLEPPPDPHPSGD